MSIEHTKTAENLRKALAGESIARNKYTYFAQAAQSPPPLNKWRRTR